MITGNKIWKIYKIQRVYFSEIDLKITKKDQLCCFFHILMHSSGIKWQNNLQNYTKDFIVGSPQLSTQLSAITTQKLEFDN